MPLVNDIAQAPTLSTDPAADTTDRVQSDFAGDLGGYMEHVGRTARPAAAVMARPSPRSATRP